MVANHEISSTHGYSRFVISLYFHTLYLSFSRSNPSFVLLPLTSRCIGAVYFRRFHRCYYIDYLRALRSRIFDSGKYRVEIAEFLFFFLSLSRCCSFYRIVYVRVRGERGECKNTKYVYACSTKNNWLRSLDAYRALHGVRSRWCALRVAPLPVLAFIFKAMQTKARLRERSIYDKSFEKP